MLHTASLTVFVAVSVDYSRELVHGNLGWVFQRHLVRNPRLAHDSAARGRIAYLARVSREHRT